MISIVGTPIGNLQDLSLRQARTIAGADVLLAEDTRSAGILIAEIGKQFGISRKPGQKLISYYKDQEFEKLPEIFEMIESGLEIALISEAGMPLISDPGGLLVKELVKRSVPFMVIPGPTAVTTALVYTGMNFLHFTFYGFLPKRQSEVRKVLTELKSLSSYLEKCPFIFYESANRIVETLQELSSIDPAAQVAVSRELTKMFEETVRGTPSEIIQHKFKGEIVMTVLFSSSS